MPHAQGASTPPSALLGSLTQDETTFSQDLTGQHCWPRAVPSSTPHPLQSKRCPWHFRGAWILLALYGSILSPVLMLPIQLGGWGSPTYLSPPQMHSSKPGTQVLTLPPDDTGAHCPPHALYPAR